MPRWRVCFQDRQAQALPKNDQSVAGSGWMGKRFELGYAYMTLPYGIAVQAGVKRNLRAARIETDKGQLETHHQ